jgi:[ribosomal protein S5]-alanine N-acetyltransferase
VTARLRLPVLSARLSLRAFRTGDFDAFRAIAKDRSLLIHMPDAPPPDAALAREFARLLRPSARRFELAVTARVGGALIGRCELLRVGRSEAEIGYVLARREWRRGFATELTRALAEAAFASLPLKRIRALVEARNAASRRVLEKAGFRWCAHRPHLARAKGRRFDVDEFERWRETPLRPATLRPPARARIIHARPGRRRQ